MLHLDACVSRYDSNFTSLSVRADSIAARMKDRAAKAPWPSVSGFFFVRIQETNSSISSKIGSPRDKGTSSGAPQSFPNSFSFRITTTISSLNHLSSQLSRLPQNIKAYRGCQGKIKVERLRVTSPGKDSLPRHLSQLPSF
jgi:hypothetical protein